MAEANKKQVRVILWSVYRSLSTAVLRAMCNKKSCLAILEPYMRSYLLSAEKIPSFDSYEGEPSFNYKVMKATLYEAEYPDVDEVFVKDMSVYLFAQTFHKPEDLVPKGYVHTFLIRRPEDAVKSLFKAVVRHGIEISQDQGGAGFKQSWDLYNIIKEQTGTAPLVIDAQDLMDKPEATLRMYCEKTGLKFEESMLHWRADDGIGKVLDDAMLPPSFKESFHEELFKSTTLHGKVATEDTYEYPQIVYDAIVENQVYYDKLLAVATRV